MPRRRPSFYWNNSLGSLQGAVRIRCVASDAPRPICLQISQSCDPCFRSILTPCMSFPFLSLPLEGVDKVSIGVVGLVVPGIHRLWRWSLLLWSEAKRHSGIKRVKDWMSGLGPASHNLDLIVAAGQGIGGLEAKLGHWCSRYEQTLGRTPERPLSF